MKKLDEYINGRYISLSGIDEEYADKLKNLEGKQITECCCGCGCDCCAPCAKTCGDPLDPYNGVEDSAFKMYFYSEREIVEKLKTIPTVLDIINLHTQFSCGRFALNPSTMDNYLIFTEQMLLPSGELMQGRSFRDNQKLIEIITRSELYDIVVLVRMDNTIQVFGLQHTGSNGKEGSIKSSLTTMAKKLTTLEKIPEVKWSQILDVSIDNADDVYTFLVTYTIDPNMIPDNPHEEGTPMPINRFMK